MLKMTEALRATAVQNVRIYEAVFRANITGKTLQDS